MKKSLLGAAISQLLLGKAWPQLSGRIDGLPLHGDVRVARDAWSIPHITAGDEHDLYAALGFVHAQDRLWQMESLRRFTEGRLSEIAGEKTILADYHARMVGMPFMKREALGAMSPVEIGHLRAYADGVNAYLGQRGRDLPLEFVSMGFTPEPWTPLDSTSLLPYMSWSLLLFHWFEELLALARGGSFTEKEWNDLFPVMPGAVLPKEPFFESLAQLKVGALNPAAFLFHAGLPDKYSAQTMTETFPALGRAGGGSNNWAVARGDTGAPLLANDPHLGIALPSVWYFCHLTVPGVLNAAGCSLAGAPPIVLGRNEHVAWGFTNLLLDACDTLLFRVDPADPARYKVGASERTMTREDVAIRLPKGKSITLPFYRTEHGPVITAAGKGVEAIAVLRWYGTLAPGAVQDYTFRGAFAFMKAKNTAELLDAGKWWRYPAQNVVAADDQGHIGWHAFGAAPVRREYSGRLPADGSAGQDWTGFLPYEELPHSFDPPNGWIATANNPPAGWSGPALSFTWAPPDRYERICCRVADMKSPVVADFRRLQADVHVVQADRLLPKVLALPLVSATAKEAASILRAWDREATAESGAAALWEIFMEELVLGLVADRFGDDLALYLNAKAYGIEQEILDRPHSSFWDGKTSVAHEVDAALCAAMDTCRARMGRNPSSWRWGKLHRYLFVHPGATGRFTSWLLNRGPYAAPGSNNTVNVSWSSVAADSWDVTTIPSMRMIASLDSMDSFWISGPLGQSGQPGHPHYDDMMPLFMAGEQAHVPLSAAGVDKVTKEVLVLTP